MHQNDCKHTHRPSFTNAHTCRAGLSVRVRGRCLLSGQGEVTQRASVRCIYFDCLHCAYIHAYVALDRSSILRVGVLYVRVQRRTKYVHCHGRSSLTAHSGSGERCTSERQYHCSVCKTKLTYFACQLCFMKFESVSKTEVTQVKVY